MSMRAKRFNKSTIIVLCSVLVLSLLQFVGLSDGKAEAAEEYKIVGYYPSWAAYGRDYQVYDMDVSDVTHINYAFADICWEGRHGNPDPEGPNPQTWACEDENGVINVPNGSIVLGDPWIDVQKSNPGDSWDEPIKGNFKQLMKLKEENPHLKTIISVGGWSWSNRFSDVAANPEFRENFANSAVDFIRKYGFDGVDIDWEYPVGGGLPGNSTRPEDKQNHTLLLQAVRDKLDAAEEVDGKEYVLTIASGAGPDYVENNELDKIADIVDWINIMTYDFNGGWQTISAHNAPLYYDPEADDAGVPHAPLFNIEAAVQGHLDAGVPSHKIVLGTPFYGRGWGGCENMENGQYQDCDGVANVGTWENGVFDYTDLQDNYINKNGYTRYWNDVAKVPYLYNPTNGIFISYDDVESFGHKIDFIKANGLGGAMFWEFSGDRNNDLLNKLTSELQGPVIIDDEPPTVPGNLKVTDVTSRSVSLEWDASTDNVGVAGYTVSYGSNTVDVTGTSTTISGLSPDTTYTFTVKARDLAGNESDESDPVTVTTEESSDPIPPTPPTDLQVTGKTTTSISLSWTASTDNVGVIGYTISYGSKSLDVTETTATITGLTPGTTYTFSVVAKDAEGNESEAATIEATTNEGDTCTEPAWSPSTVYIGGERVSYNGKIYEAKWWTQGDRPDQSGEWGAWKFIENCEGEGDDGNGGDGDTEPPTAPTDLQVTDTTSTSVSLSWTASTDNVGVTGYTVTYGSNRVDVTETSVTISDLSPNTTYTFTVAAMDAAGNVSSETSVQATTDDPQPGEAEPWAPGVSYTAGDEVTYGGATYVCLQSHTSLPGWEPSNISALWKVK